MKDSERAKTYLGDLYTRKPGGHAYEPGSYVRADQDALHIAELMDLLAEVREDERNKLRYEKTSETRGGDMTEETKKRFRDREGDTWIEYSDNGKILRLGGPLATQSKKSVEEQFGPLVELED